jgi:hypothetical protein
MSKLFKYLNLNEADIKLLDPETIQMGEVVDIMQKTYMGAQDGKKKDILANMIAETVALVLARVNSIKGLSKDAKKKIEEEAKELPKAPKMPQKAPKQPKEQPKQQEPPKEEKLPFEVGQFWMNNVIDKKMQLIDIIPSTDTVWFDIFRDGTKTSAFYSLQLALERVENGDWVLIKEEEEQPNEDNPMPQDEPETIEEIKNAISGLSLLAKMGDEEAKIEIKRLKLKLKNK